MLVCVYAKQVCITRVYARVCTCERERDSSKVSREPRKWSRLVDSVPLYVRLHLKARVKKKRKRQRMRFLFIVVKSAPPPPETFWQTKWNNPQMYEKY